MTAKPPDDDATKTAPVEGLRAEPRKASATGRYEIGNEHGRGGIGRVLRATDRVLDRTVAIKELLSDSRLAKLRFEREARITARLEHPSIVPVHDAGSWPEDGRPYYSMKLISGRSLRDVIAQTPALSDRLGLIGNVLAVAEAIAYAHDQGVIHRDLKPSNVIVGAYGETVVIDWGLAKELSSEEPDELHPYRTSTAPDATATGAILGTPAYMPPEQARGEPVDERADVYALGALLYHLLAGKPPYQDTPGDLLERVRAEPPPRLREVEPAVPGDLDAIVGVAMDRDPERRYRDAGELARDLKRYLDGKLVAARSYSPGAVALRWAWRHRAITGLIVFFTVALLVAGAWFLARERNLRREAERERDRATEEQRRADAQTLALLEQRGRLELDAGNPFRAGVFLGEAYRRAPDSRALRELTSQALALMRAKRLAIPGHEHEVGWVEYSRDGSTLISTDSAGVTRLWSADDGKPLATFDSGQRVVWAAVSPDNRLVATSETDGITLWDRETGDKVRRLTGLDAFRGSFSPDGTLLVAGTYNGQVWLFDVATGDKLASTALYGDRVGGIVWRADGSGFATSAWDGRAHLWERSGTMVRQLLDHTNALSWIDFDPITGNALISDRDVALFIVDPKTGTTLKTMSMPPGTRWATVQYTPDGSRIVITGNNRMLRVLHAASGTVLASIDAARGKLIHGSLRPDGREIATTGVDQEIVLWRLDDLGYRIVGGDRRSGIASLPSEWTAGGDRFVTGTSEGLITLWDVASAKVIHDLDIPGNAFSVAPNRDGTRVLSSGTSRASMPVAIWDLASGDKVRELAEHERLVYNVAASADGSRFATASYDGSVRQWDTDGNPVGAVLEGEGRITAVALDPSSPRIAFSNEHGLVRVHHRDTGDLIRELPAHSSWIQDLVFSADGRWLVTAGRHDFHARIWNLATGELVQDVIGHHDNLLRVSLSRDRETLATVSVDKSAMLWDVATGELLRTIPGPSYSAEISPDGTTLLTTGLDDYIVLWQLGADDRPATDVWREIQERTPWRLEGGELVDTSAPTVDSDQPGGHRR